MRRATAMTLALVLVGAGCSHDAGARPARGRGPRPTAMAAGAKQAADATRLVAFWSTPLAGGPGGVAADRAGAVVSVDDDSVVALDRDGHERWSTAVPGAGLGWPLLDDGLVVVPTLRDAGGPGGCVALARSSGDRVWAYEERDSQGVAVARAGRLVVCALGNGVVVGLDRTSGTRVWRSVVAPRVPRDSVSIAERTALAVDPATGTLAFTVRLGSGWFLAMLDLRTGADRGAVDFTKFGGVSAPVSTAPGTLAVGVSGARKVCALDLRRRRIGACVAAPDPSGFDPASIPLVAGDLVVIVGREGVVTAVDLRARKLRWSVRIANPVLSARPVLAGGVVMGDDWTRTAWAVRLADGGALPVPSFDGWVISAVADTGGGFEVAERDMDGGGIERWVPAH